LALSFRVLFHVLLLTCPVCVFMHHSQSGWRTKPFNSKPGRVHRKELYHIITFQSVPKWPDPAVKVLLPPSVPCWRPRPWIFGGHFRCKYIMQKHISHGMIFLMFEHEKRIVHYFRKIVPWKLVIMHTCSCLHQHVHTKASTKTHTHTLNDIHTHTHLTHTHTQRKTQLQTKASLLT
jgi:branched-subunit amino acid transport protein AzlD